MAGEEKNFSWKPRCHPCGGGRSSWFWEMLMFKVHYLPCGRAAAEVGGTAVPREVTLTPRSHVPTTNIPPDILHGREGVGRRTALPSPPAPHAHPGAGSTPYLANPEQALSSQSPPPGTKEGSYGHPRRCHRPLWQPRQTGAACHRSPPQLRVASPAPWENPRTRPGQSQLCPREMGLARMHINLYIFFFCIHLW